MQRQLRRLEHQRLDGRDGRHHRQSLRFNSQFQYVLHQFNGSDAEGGAVCGDIQSTGTFDWSSGSLALNGDCPIGVNPENLPYSVSGDTLQLFEVSGNDTGVLTFTKQ